jgi:hypothetical protein
LIESGLFFRYRPQERGGNIVLFPGFLKAVIV